MNVCKKLVLVIFTASMLHPFSVAAESITLHAAGSLKAALGELAAAYQQEYGVAVATKFGPSGLLLKGIEAGESPDVFASANMQHPEKLAAAGWGRPVVLFTRNSLCALAQPEVEVTSASLLEVLLSKAVRVGTSTPKADPSGDYAWELFARAEALKPGSKAILAGKALQLTGGPASEVPPEGRNPYGWVMSEKKADLFLTYCTNGVAAKKEVNTLQIIALPEQLAVGADYGLLVKKDAPPAAWQLAMYIMSPGGQRILASYGFQAVASPR